MPKLRDIEPQHFDVGEISRERIEFGDGYPPVGGATVMSAWSPEKGTEYKIGFGIYGVRGKDLLVRYEGGYRHGTDGTGGHEERYLWVSASAFSTIEIYARFRDDGDD